MEYNDFIRIVTCFADHRDHVLAEHGELLVRIRDEEIIAKVRRTSEGLIVVEEDQRLRADSWIINRVARIPLLARRICSYILPPAPFVKPSGGLLDKPDQAPSDKDTYQEDAVKTLKEALGNRSAGMTSGIYLTSGAGEGKTSLIDFVAVQQAKAYIAKRSDWLLVPIPLSGRAFLRFDDAVVSALVNRLRFQLLYYDAFLELVRLGVLVPAFDGFEEMIVESSSGEAISALGNLVARLRSAGTLLVAARQAYFDYPSFRSQAALFDSIGSQQDVAFSRVSLNRWERDKFELYARRRGVQSPERLFDAVGRRVGKRDHPLLTRAVLVKRLVDFAKEDADLQFLLERLGQEPPDFFYEFVSSIVGREANVKWLDLSGDPPRAILTIEEHHELLAMLAHEMWLSATDDLRMDVVSLVVELFADFRDKTPTVKRQIGERIKTHALLVATGFSGALAFDHEAFKLFYLGQYLGQMLVERDFGALRSVFEKRALPAPTVKEAVTTLQRRGVDLDIPLELLQTLADGELMASFVRENCGALAIALVAQAKEGSHELRNMNFPDHALRQRRLRNLTVSGSYFQSTSLANTELLRCKFMNCDFQRIEVNDTQVVSETSLDDRCKIRCVVRISEDDQLALFDPKRIQIELRRAGFKCGKDVKDEFGTVTEKFDYDLRLVQRFLRIFLRASALTESTIQRRLGIHAAHFFRSIQPQLIEVGVVNPVTHRGHGNQKCMKLSVPMTKIEEAMSAAGGDFGNFVNAFREIH